MQSKINIPNNEKPVKSSLKSLILISQILLLSSLSACQNQSIEKTLPEIHIFPSKTINFENKENCLMVFEDNGIIHSLSAKIKCRGGYSSKFYKHSYRIELNQKLSPFGLPREDDWILNANYIDKTFMRHKLSYDLFRLMGENNLAPECLYVNVKVNNAYNGLYVLMQRINGKFCNLNKKDDKAFVCKDPLVFFDKIPEELLKNGNYHDQKYPETTKHDFTAMLDEFREFVFRSSDSVFLADIGKRIDINNVLDWHILLLLTNNADGLNKNFYLYRIDSKTPMRIAIWDYDHSFGRDGDNELNMLTHEIDCSRNIMLKRLMEIDNSEYPNMLKVRWLQLRESNIISISELKKMILINHFIIKNDIDKNFEKWPVNSEDYFDENNYSQEIAILTQFIELRIPQLDNYFKTIVK
ncbi:MAG: CotH kinase family protein [Bacteroidales bacterium]|nr:CotH kinase family protein [Bacteroidales bacterium]